MMRALFLSSERCKVPSDTPIISSLPHAPGQGESKPLSAIERYAKASMTYENKLRNSTQAIRQAFAQFSPLIQASSLGAEDVVITHLIEKEGLDIPTFVLETGALHPETVELLQRAQARAGIPVQVFRPQAQAIDSFVTVNGSDAMYRSIALRKACCGIRKMEPLARALEGQRAWITGLRQEQSGARAEVPLVDMREEASGGRIKCNPLAHWTWGDVWHYIALHGLDYNPLHDSFFPSIGCAPCTRAISDGEDFRAGRWWWESENAKECGLHVKETTP